MSNDVLKLSPRITLMPVIHGSGDFALEVRRWMLEHKHDCIAVPLPSSFQEDVETAIMSLPSPTVVIQRASEWATQWRPDSDEEDDDDEDAAISYVPVDPCQAVIMALRVAMGEHIPREFIDLETKDFEPHSTVLPDAYALKQVDLERFVAAILPTVTPLPSGQPQHRVEYMAKRLHELEEQYESILCVCSVIDWPWIRQAYRDQVEPTVEEELYNETTILSVDPQTLVFMLGELPFITGLYERARAELDDDENLSIDGVKELLQAARDAYRKEFRSRAKKVTPHHLSQCLKYIRNLSLIQSRMTPDMYSIVVAAQQIVGDQFALHVAETIGEFPYTQPTGYESVGMSIGRGRLPNGDIVEMVSRLPGPTMSWTDCKLHRRPDKSEQEKWKTRWDPYSQCSWPPEDQVIENFRAHVFDRAREVMGSDLARTEKFTTSIKDGIDIRDTLRHWYEGDIYVKVLPPTRGSLDCAVMLFDSPADPRDYPWRTTWFAEHNEESTLAFYATDFSKEPVGPGICLANYGGALFLFPPAYVPDIWQDPRLDFTETMEERILAAACLHSQSPHIALVSAAPPGAGWRRLAKRYGKRWIHLPLSRFSSETVQQLRMVHVLNGKEVRSFAADFIRKA
jgi:hypothetical protein